MANVAIGSNTYFVYATVDEADAYLLPSSYNAAWSALSTDEKSGHLVESARIIDRQKWKAGYDTQEKRSVVEGIIDGSIVVAAMLASGESEFVSSATTATKTKRLKAGSAEVENFRDFSAAANSRFPVQLMELFGQYLGSNGGGLATVGGSFVSGVSGCSQAGQAWGYNGGI